MTGPSIQFFQCQESGSSIRFRFFTTTNYENLKRQDFRKKGRKKEKSKEGEVAKRSPAKYYRAISKDGGRRLISDNSQSETLHEQPSSIVPGHRLLSETVNESTFTATPDLLSQPATTSDDQLCASENTASSRVVSYDDINNEDLRSICATDPLRDSPRVNYACDDSNQHSFATFQANYNTNENDLGLVIHNNRQLEHPLDSTISAHLTSTSEYQPGDRTTDGEDEQAAQISAMGASWIIEEDAKLKHLRDVAQLLWTDIFRYYLPHKMQPEV